MRKSVLKRSMARKGIENNCKTIILQTNPPSNLLSEEINKLCSVFGDIENVQLTQSGAVVTFTKSTAAFLAVETLDHQMINGICVDVSFDKSVLCPMTTEFTTMGDVFLPLEQLEDTERERINLQPPGYMRYV